MPVCEPVGPWMFFCAFLLVVVLFLFVMDARRDDEIRHLRDLIKQEQCAVQRLTARREEVASRRWEAEREGYFTDRGPFRPNDLERTLLAGVERQHPYGRSVCVDCKHQLLGLQPSLCRSCLSVRANAVIARAARAAAAVEMRREAAAVYGDPPELATAE